MSVGKARPAHRRHAAQSARPKRQPAAYRERCSPRGPNPHTSAGQPKSGAAIFERLRATAALTNQAIQKDDYFNDEKWDMDGMKSDLQRYKADAAAAGVAAAAAATEVAD